MVETKLILDVKSRFEADTGKPPCPLFPARITGDRIQAAKLTLMHDGLKGAGGLFGAIGASGQR
jgi:hypothetical protein